MTTRDPSRQPTSESRPPDLGGLSLEALLASGVMHRELLERQGEGFSVVDAQERFLLVNPAAERMFGVPPGQLVGRCVLDFLTPEQQALVRRETGRRAQGDCSTYELVIRREDGTFRTLQVTATPRSTGTGDDLQVISVFRDITESRATEARLRESEERFRVLFEAAPDAILLADPETRLILDVNSAACRLLGRERHELVGMSQAQLHPPVAEQYSEETFQRHVQEAQADGFTRPIENVVLRADGTQVPVEVVAQLVHFQEQAVLVGTFRDISERRRAETELEHSRAELKAIYDHAPVMICVSDADRRVLSVNPAFTAFTGTAQEDLNHRDRPGEVLGCIHAVLNPAGCDLGEECQTCTLRLALADTLETGVTHSHIEHHTRLQGDVATREAVLLASTALFQANGQKHLLLCLIDITGRIQAERALQSNEARYHAQFDLASEGIFSMSLEGQILEANEAVARMHGYTRDEMLGLVLKDLDTPEGTLLAPERFRRLLAGESLSFELEHFHKDGHAFPLEINASLMNADGQPFILSFQRDITARKGAEEALRQSQARLQRAEVVARFGNWELNLTEGKVRGSTGAQALYGLEGDEWSMAEPRGLALPEYWAQLDKALAGLIERNEPYRVEFRIRRPSDGQLRDIQSIAEFDPNRQIVFGVIKDITQRKQAEAALRAQKEQYDNLVASIRVGVYLIRSGPDGAFPFDYASSRMADLFGLDLEALRADSQLIFEAIHPDDREAFVKLNQESLRDQVPFDWQGRVLVGGAVRWLHVASQPTPQENGDLLWHGVVTDITDRILADEEHRQLQKQLNQAQKMESLGSLAGGVAHDMNNVLGAILGLASAHVESQVPGTPTHRAFGTIIKAAERGGNTLKSLLSFARHSSAEMRELDLNVLLREEALLLERTTLAKVRLVLELAADLRPMRGDASDLTQAFMNLCVNAVDAMAENGTLTLRTRNHGPDWIEVQVEDTGTGMPPEVLEKAMDPFFTTKDVGKGTGLGLSMVYSTVKAHQGRIDLRSDPGRGTCVTMRFPSCATEAQDPQASGRHRTRPQPRALKVLLVDDDELIQSSMQAVLEALGHEVSTARSGEEGLAKLENGLRPDAVILDMNMPGLGGAGTLPRLRALLPLVPVLLATGRADQAAMDLARLHPAVTLLAKPFSMKTLQTQLETITLSRA